MTDTTNEYPTEEPTASGIAGMDEYLALATILLGREPEQRGLGVPDFADLFRIRNPPPPNRGDLTDGDEQRLAARVCQLVQGMTAERWAGLSEVERVGWLQEAVGRLKTSKTPESADWLTLASVARGLSWYLNQGKGKRERPDSARVARLGLDDNGEKGHKRRISRASVIEYCLSQGLEWNELVATSRKVVADL